MTLAVITPVHGRHAHLRLQEASLVRSSVRPDVRVVVAMDDPGLEAHTAPGTVLVTMGTTAAGLPLARARNFGAQAALDAGADLLVFLDVDCLVEPGTLARYRGAATDPRTSADVLTGPTGYLPEPGPDGYDLDALPDAHLHPGRPNPTDGQTAQGVTPTLFWSLSFATAAATWRRIDGFDESYAGYGGEDTDFALRAERAGVGLTFVGGALTWHQWHPVTSPPVEHVDDLLRNGAVFAERWGWWPMQGWFEQLERLGHVMPDGAGWRRTAGPGPASAPAARG